MKIIIDIIMFILMLLEFSRGYMKPIFHEIIGILLLVCIIIHLILNRNYIKNIFNGKYNLKRYIMLIVNSILFISLFLSMIFGILSSQELLKFMNISNMTIINLHKIFAYISLIFMAVHLGLNFNLMFGKIYNKINKYVMYIIELVIICYGIYSFLKLDILKHLLGIYGFSILEGNIAVNICRYFCIIIMITLIINFVWRKNER